MHLTLRLSNACLHAFDCQLFLCMPPRITLRTFPAHASMHFTIYFPGALASVLALCMPLCLSLSTLPVHASMHFTLPTFPARASTHFSLYLPYAFHCALSLRMPLCISLSTFPTQLSCAERNDFAERNPSQCFREKLEPSLEGVAELVLLAPRAQRLQELWVLPWPLFEPLRAKDWVGFFVLSTLCTAVVSLVVQRLHPFSPGHLVETLPSLQTSRDGASSRPQVEQPHKLGINVFFRSPWTHRLSQVLGTLGGARNATILL